MLNPLVTLHVCTGPLNLTVFVAVSDAGITAHILYPLPSEHNLSVSAEMLVWSRHDTNIKAKKLCSSKFISDINAEKWFRSIFRFVLFVVRVEVKRVSDRALTSVKKPTPDFGDAKETRV